jgi:rubrerythrin
MDDINFNKIIDFAVEKEREAVDFYHDLQKSAKFSAQRTMLQELENMEENHILILEKMRKRNGEIHKNAPIKDLKIADYTTADDLEPDSYQNILLIAMKREDKAKTLYLDLANRYTEKDPELSRLFHRLAAEEAGHKLKFEKLYDEYVLKDN